MGERGNGNETHRQSFSMMVSFSMSLANSGGSCCVSYHPVQPSASCQCVCVCVYVCVCTQYVIMMRERDLHVRESLGDGGRNDDSAESLDLVVLQSLLEALLCSHCLC